MSHKRVDRKIKAGPISRNLKSPLIRILRQFNAMLIESYISGAFFKGSNLNGAGLNKSSDAQI